MYQDCKLKSFIQVKLSIELAHESTRVTSFSTSVYKIYAILFDIAIFKNVLLLLHSYVCKE